MLKRVFGLYLTSIYIKVEVSDDIIFIFNNSNLPMGYSVGS